VLNWIIINRLILLFDINIWNIHIKILYFDWMISVYFLLTFHSKLWQRVTLPVWNYFPWELNLWNIFSCFIFIFFFAIFTSRPVCLLSILRGLGYVNANGQWSYLSAVCVWFFFFNVQNEMLCTKHIIVFSIGKTFPMVLSGEIVPSLLARTLCLTRQH